MGERIHSGSAVALHHNALQPQKRRAIIPTWVDLGTQRLQYGPGKQTKRATTPVRAERQRDPFVNQFGQPFARLQSDVAGEPITDHDVGSAAPDSIALNVSNVVEPVAAGHQLSSYLDLLAPFDGFLTDIEQPHGGGLHPPHRTGQH